MSPTNSRSDEGHNRRGHRPRVDIRVDAPLATVVVLVVVGPLLFTNSGFAGDFTNHLWLVWAAGKALVQAGHPSYFFNTTNMGVFYPFYAFYGGTLYAITGAIAELIGGHPIVAFVGVTTLAVAGSYAGMLWLGRELGLRGWTAHAPALAVVTSAYYITNLYGRAAWPEFMAIAVISPLAASGVHLVRTKTWRPAPVLVFVLSMVIFTGSHNITLVWGSAILALAVFLMWLASGAPRRLPSRRFVMVAGLGVAATLVNAWFLIPDLAYGKDVTIGGASGISATFFDAPSVLFDPLRYVPSESTTRALYVQAPIWFLAWGLLAGALLLWRRSATRGLRRAWIGATGMVAVVLGLIMVEPLLNAVPFPFNEIQFPYRLGSYLFYAVAGLVLVGAMALERAASASARRVTKGLRFALVGVCAVNLGLCVWQLWVPNTLTPHAYENRGEALASVNKLPRTWYDPGAYADAQAPIVEAPSGRVLLIPPEAVRDDRFEAWMNVPPGPQPILTDILAGAYLAHISGLERVGRDVNGYAVVRRIDGGSGPVHVVVETTRSLPIDLGRALSVLAILVVLAVLAVLSHRAVRARAPARSRP